MFVVQYQARVRAEVNQTLLKEAETVRWMHRIEPRRTNLERFGRRLYQRAAEWLERQTRPIPCNEALPACGMTTIA